MVILKYLKLIYVNKYGKDHIELTTNIMICTLIFIFMDIKIKHIVVDKAKTLQAYLHYMVKLKKKVILIPILILVNMTLIH